MLQPIYSRPWGSNHEFGEFGSAVTSVVHQVIHDHSRIWFVTDRPDATSLVHDIRTNRALVLREVRPPRLDCRARVLRWSTKISRYYSDHLPETRWKQDATMNRTHVAAVAQHAVISTVDQSATSTDPPSRASSRGSTRSSRGKPKAASTSRAGGSNRHVNGAPEDAVVVSDELEDKDQFLDDSQRAAHLEDDREQDARSYTMQEADEMSFIIDTAGDMDVDREIALEDQARADQADTHVEAGLLLPSHVNVIPQSSSDPVTQPGASSSDPSRHVISDVPEDEDLEGDIGDFEQLDMDPSTANRYYGAEEKAERRAKEQCLACGELGHDRRHCPHQHCLACGAMDDHPTRFCPMSTSCFRCGGMGHQTRTCPKPRRAPRSEECQRCGSFTHVNALCPTLWRVYSYTTSDHVDRHRAKVFLKLQGSSKARDPRRDLEPDPEELSDSEDEFIKAGEPELPTGSSSSWSQFDPATRWCYNCSTSGNHWGDDCPEPRCNPTRGTGEPSAFSEFVSRLGPFSKLLPGAPPLAGFQMPSSQFTFNVGNSATMHVAADALPSSSGRSTPNGINKRHAIGRHVLSSPNSSRTASPVPNIVSFGRTKAVAVEGGLLTRKEAKKNKTPLPENLFKEWIRDRHDYPEHAHEIRSALEERADLQAKGLDTTKVRTTKEIVGDAAKRTGRRQERASTNRNSDASSDPAAARESEDDFRDDFSTDSSHSQLNRQRKKKRRADGKNARASHKSKKDTVHTGWAHTGDGPGNSGRKESKRARFSNKRQEDRGGNPGERRGGGSGSGGRGKTTRRGGSARAQANSSTGARGGGKVRGGGSKYRGSYF